MATMLGSLLVSLGLESGEFKSGLSAAEKEMRKSAKRIENIGKNMARTGRNLSIAVSAPLAALGVASFKTASDAAEMESAFEVSFGNSAKSVRQWAESNGDAMGRSTQEMMSMAASFQDILKNQLSPQESVGLSKTLTLLTQDLASFKNLSNDVAQQKILSGLIGEAEPLRAVGVLLSDAAVKAQAAKMGMGGLNAELTEGQKVQARAALIMEQLSDAQGDVIRTSDSTANKIKSARAAFEELQVAIGQKLLPALTPLIDALANALNAFNRLPSGIQTAVVVVGGLALALGPVIYAFGTLTTLLAPFIAQMKAAAFAVQYYVVTSSSMSAALAGLRTSLMAATAAMLPMAVALGAIAAAIYIVIKRSEQGTQASAQYRDQQEKLKSVQDRVTDATEKLAVATGQARKEAIANAKAVRQETVQYLANAKAALAAARAKARTKILEANEVRFSAGNAMSGGSAMSVGGNFAAQRTDVAARQARTDAQAALNTVKGLEAELKRIDTILAAPAPVVGGVASPSTSGSGRTGRTGGGPSGPSAAEIERRFQEERIGYIQQSLGAMQQIAQSAQERAELEMRSIEWSRKQAVAQIAADEDYNEAQKAELTAAVERLADYERMGVEFREMQELERERNDLLQVAFDRDRELLQLQGDVADTQAERKAIAMDILRIEQEYRRNQLEMLVASATASDAEKRRAQAILDSLAAIEAGETAATSRANETDAEKYMRGLNKSPGQISEELDRIKINGLENLNDALTDAIVNFKSLKDVAHNVIKSILADLLRLQIQQAIIKPLAQAMGLGVPGFAMGTNFAPGGLAIVGERGPELVNLPRGSKVFPNGQTEAMLGGGANVTINANFAGMNDRQMREASGQLARRMRQELNAA